MNREELQAIAQAAAKNIKTPEDLNEFQQMLTRITVEAALNVGNIVGLASLISRNEILPVLCLLSYEIFLQPFAAAGRSFFALPTPKGISLIGADKEPSAIRLKNEPKKATLVTFLFFTKFTG